MSRSHYKIYDTNYPYFMTSSFVEGIPVFAYPDAAQIVLNSLVFLQTKREVALYSYVLMENHFHIIARGDNLSEKMRRLKSYTARRIITLFDQTNKIRLLKQFQYAKLRHKSESLYQVWQEGLHPQQIIGDDMMIQKMEYIHQNPVKRGYVDRPEDWRYSSARSYLQLEGLIPVTLYER